MCPSLCRITCKLYSEDRFDELLQPFNIIKDTMYGFSYLVDTVLVFAGYQHLTLALTCYCCLSTAARRSWERDCWKPSPMPKVLVCSEPPTSKHHGNGLLLRKPTMPCPILPVNIQCTRWQDRPEYVCESHLKRRWWKNGLIRAFL